MAADDQKVGNAKANASGPARALALFRLLRPGAKLVSTYSAQGNPVGTAGPSSGGLENSSHIAREDSEGVLPNARSMPVKQGLPGQELTHTQVASIDKVSGEGKNELISPVPAQSAGFHGKIIAEHYQLIESVGSGGCGTVFKAKHLLLNKFVAIKLLPSEHQADTRFVQRFEREAQAASRLDHPNLVRVLEFGIEDGTPYLVMELVEGTTLSSLLRAKGRLRAIRATEIALQISAGLAHAHKRGIIHRDIKPSNIIITTDHDGNEIAKVVDFGIAKVLSDAGQINHTLTVTGEIIGTPLFMSPEQCLGQELDERSDIYSLGCVLYQMVSGQPAVTAENAIGAMMAHANEVHPDFTDVPVAPYFRSIVEKCIKRDPAKRFANMTQLYKALARSSREDFVAMLGKLDLTFEEHRAFKFFRQSEPVATAWCNGSLIGWLCGVFFAAVLVYVLLLLPVLNYPFINGDWSSSMNTAKHMEIAGRYGAAQHFYDQAELAALRDKSNEHLVQALNAKAELYKKHPIPADAASQQLSDDVRKSVQQGVEDLTPRKSDR